MKSLIKSSQARLLVLSLWVSSAAWAQAPAPASVLASASAESLKVPVELEWEEVPGAKVYELEFQNFEGKVLKTFKSSSPIFKFKFKAGIYKVRSRVADARKVFGEWSALEEFRVQPKPVTIPEKSIVTKGVIDPKTLEGEVLLRWGAAQGATHYRVQVKNEKSEIVKEEIVSGLSLKTQLPAGVYEITLTALGPEGIASDPVTLPGKVVMDTVQLAKPVMALEELPDPRNPKTKLQRLHQTQGRPTIRWKEASKVADTVGTLEYSYFFSEEWMPVENFTSKNAQEVILEKASKPGRYRISAWSEATGLKKSEVTTYEFVVKPTEY